VSEAIPRSGVRPCPSCGEVMRLQSYERKTNGRLELDLCYSCQAIWFDAYESSQLTAGSVMKLFEAIHECRDAQARPLADVCRCPVCRQALALTHDIQRTNRITYYRCAGGHGRLSTFYQFLREKNFIRSLTVGEIAQLKAVVKQVRCTSCGAPVDLERDSQCSFCRAPIAILDADAVKKALGELTAEERKRRTVDPTAAVDALLAGRRSGRATRGYDFQSAAPSWNAGGVVDLVGEAVDFLMSLE